jgi:betaine-aldehyde dehydrogenase
MTTATAGDTRQAAAVARHWVDGRWRESAKQLDSLNPATGEVIGRYALAGEVEARAAVAAALSVFRETSWKSDRALRSRVLFEMAERFEARFDALVRLLSLDNGKVAPEAAFEVGTAAPALRYCGVRVAGVLQGDAQQLLRDARLERAAVWPLR